MKGDFSRFTFNGFKHYAGVLHQQGRVWLDSDWNEEVLERLNLLYQETRDVIGNCGVPKAGSAFKVAPNPDPNAAPDDFLIGGGRCYVDGILCQFDQDTTYLTQPDLPDPPRIHMPADGRDLDAVVYLEVWQRLITYLEDDALREIALDGPDTTTRLKSIAQVRVAVVPPGTPASDLTCANVEQFLPKPGKGTLTTLQPVDTQPEDLCRLPDPGTFTGRENRLYRVEIHEGGDPAGPSSSPLLSVVRFKWSRNNAAFAVRVTAVASDGLTLTLSSLGRDQATALREGDLVEITDDGSELGPARGHLTHLTADPDPDQFTVSVADPLPSSLGQANRHLILRRWDGVGAAKVLFSEKDTPDMDLGDGVHIQFGGSDLRPGDYWQFTARSANGSVQSLVDAPPTGIVRHYCPLAIVRWSPQVTSPPSSPPSSPPGQGPFAFHVVEHCRLTFPPLTEITARDVEFDPGSCVQEDPQWGQVGTVQEAIDALCRLDVGVDLKEHNKFVHGYGVVCGLKVRCGSDRSHVTVGRGYALDCEGSTIRVRNDLPFDIVNQAQNRGLLHSGTGEVCLTISRGLVQDAELDVQALVPQTFWESVLEGTLLMDFFKDCIEKPLTSLLQQFLPFPATTVPVPDSHKRLVSFLNLLWQLINPATAQYVFLSSSGDRARPAEHEFLLNFYVDLLNVIRSKTFCAMFDHVTPFPDYPYQVPPGIETGFGLFRFHKRLRLHGLFAYTCWGGADLKGAPAGGISPNKIHVYDLATHNLVQSLDFPGGQNLEVSDIAFSHPDGNTLYAVAILNGQDSVFAAFDTNTNTWGPTHVFCNIKLVSLATHAAQQNSLFAIGKSSVANKRGLYKLNPTNIPATLPPPDVAFHGTGLLELSTDGGTAFAAENFANASGPEATSFDQIRSINLSSLSAPPVVFHCSGLDADNDVAFTGNNLFVTGDPAAGQVKTLYRFDVTNGQLLNQPGTDLTVNTITRLAPLTALPAGDFLLVTMFDQHKVVRVGLSNNALDSSFRVPIQLYPIDIVTNQVRNEVYALNFLSNTLSVVSVPAVFEASPLPFYTHEPPSTLSLYRDQILQAYGDVLSKFLQYLKDCFCDKFLIACPECGPGDKVYLGCVEIRDSKVYNICNLTKRRYVKSVKNWEYWLSVVPVIPAIKELFAEFCCKVLE